MIRLFFAGPASTGEIDETQNYYPEDESVPAIEFTSVCADLPRITVTPESLPFGNVVQGGLSDRNVTVANEGDTDLTIGAIGQANPLSAPFSITTDNCSGQTLAAGETCTLTVRFAPTETGNFTDSFDIPSNDPDEDPVAVAVSGTGQINDIPTLSEWGIILLITLLGGIALWRLRRRHPVSLPKAR